MELAQCHWRYFDQTSSMCPTYLPNLRPILRKLSSSSSGLNDPQRRKETKWTKPGHHQSPFTLWMNKELVYVDRVQHCSRDWNSFLSQAGIKSWASLGFSGEKIESAKNIDHTWIWTYLRGTNLADKFLEILVTNLQWSGRNFFEVEIVNYGAHGHQISHPA